MRELMYYVLRNKGTYWAILAIYNDGTNKVKHVGSHQYIVKMWDKRYNHL
jgi:hypothetical protein